MLVDTVTRHGTSGKLGEASGVGLIVASYWATGICLRAVFSTFPVALRGKPGRIITRLGTL